MDEIGTGVTSDAGLPNTFMLRGKYDLNKSESDVMLTTLSTHIDSPPNQGPVKSRKRLQMLLLWKLLVKGYEGDGLMICSFE